MFCSMKCCSKCKQLKELSEFYKNKTKKDGYSGLCRLCHKQLNNSSYKKNSKYYVIKTFKRREQCKQFLKEYKSNKPCKDCNNTFPPYVMDFDHIKEKTKDVSSLVYYSIAKLKKEISKCELVCANCHRIRTFNRNNKLL